jgi:hypothetical protein
LASTRLAIYLRNWARKWRFEEGAVMAPFEKESKNSFRTVLAKSVRISDKDNPKL